ncbi:hypothetical protein [Leifsonia shinshuensis]|uniref:Lipoprotein n=1 Tax=Leifsonia shinshuensis TaxID=150026 RepID=A0A853CYF3_9MICO|nr:hypothetical protein [Leifsonia shinshuensis]NYJ25582.1 hypothetical protein [Leifsonia shinshuensis]
MTITRRRRRTPPALALGFTIALAALTALAGCAGSEPVPGPQATGTPNAMTRSDWQLRYAHCMRENGIDARDPGSAGGALLDTDADQDTLMAAAGACRAKLGNPPAATAEEASEAERMALDAGREMARCYRERGYDMPDPRPGEAPQLPADASDEALQACGAGGRATPGQ